MTKRQLRKALWISGLVTLVSFCLLIEVCFGAAYTSVKTGDYNDVTVWGGSGYPSAVGDTFTVAAGHVVSVNVNVTNALGASTINGTLRPKAGSGATGLSFGNVTLTVGATGSLGDGTLLAKTDSFYISFNTSSDNANGITVTAGGVINLAGDPDFYGSTDRTTTQAQWTSGRTFTVVGDVTAKWGNEVLSAEMVVNGAFNANIASWTQASNWAWQTDGAGGGWARHTAGSTASIYQTITMVQYRIYKIIVTVGGRTSGTLTPYIGAAQILDTISANGTVTRYAIATDATPATLYLVPSTTFDGYVDNISVVEVLSGREIYIHKLPAAYSSYITDTIRASIHSMALNGSNTDITIGEAAPGVTFNLGGRVVMPSRNIVLKKAGVNLAVGQTNANRPHLLDSNTATSTKITLSNVDIQGFYRISPQYAGAFSSTVFRNGNYGFGASCINPVCSYCLFISNLYGTYGSHKVQADNCLFFANYQAGMGYSANANLTNSEVFSNGSGYNYGSDINVIDTFIYGNASGLIICTGKVIRGALSLNPSGIACANVNDSQHSVVTGTNSGAPVYSNVKFNGGNLIGNNYFNTVIASLGQTLTEHHNQVANTHNKYATFGTVSKSTSPLRTGGAASSILVTPRSLSGSSTVNETGVDILGKWVEDNVPNTAQTRSVKIKGAGISSYPTNAQLYFQALDEFGAVLATSTAVLSDNTTWTDFPVTFTRSTVGRVTYKLYLNWYQASASINADAALYRAGMPPIMAIWSEGEAHIQADYKPRNPFNVINGSVFIKGVNQ